MKILLADDHALFRDALVQYIERAEPDIHITVARDLHEAVDLIESGEKPELILLDMRMPGMNGLQGLQKIRERWADTPVALLSGLAEKHDVEAAMKMGARAYFPKTLSGRALMKAIRQVMNGETFVATDHNTGEIMPSYMNGGSHGHGTQNGKPAGDVKLTPRERDVLTELLRGATNKDIARSLDLQVVTVKLHIRSICRKLSAQNRTHAALIAREMKLI